MARQNKKEVEITDKEKAILSKLYESADGTYQSYMLTMALNPNLKSGTDESAKAYAETRDAVEHLIYLDLVMESGWQGPVAVGSILIT